MIAGIDEAGKGPVIGPMFVAGVMIGNARLNLLMDLGVKDSKKLAPKKREYLAEKIKKIANYYILEVKAIQIDELRKTMTMNEIMVECFVEVLNNLNPNCVFVDAADVKADRFANNIQEKYGYIKIVSEHRADNHYPIVSAASILAKVSRDKAVQKLEQEIGIKFGSGYPSDPSTKKFLKEWVEKYGDLPNFARHSWKTSENVIRNYKKKQRSVDRSKLIDF